MTNIVLMKTSSNTLVPADHNSAEYIRKLKLGVGVEVKPKRYNNVKFHNKLFKLVEFAYDVWANAIRWVSIKWSDRTTFLTYN